MASTLQTSISVASERLLTAADLAELPTDLPSGDVDYELDEGRLIIVAPPGETHGSLQARIAAELVYQGERPGHGKAYSEVGIVLGRDPDTVLGADLAFVCTAKFPIRKSPEGYLETIPDLVIEIRSKKDTRAKIERKGKQYIAAGVTVVLLVDPQPKTVTELRSGVEPKVYGAKDTVALEDIIPGFRLKLADHFDESLD